MPNPTEMTCTPTPPPSRNRAAQRWSHVLAGRWVVLAMFLIMHIGVVGGVVSLETQSVGQALGLLPAGQASSPGAGGGMVAAVSGGLAVALFVLPGVPELLFAFHPEIEDAFAGEWLLPLLPLCLVLAYEFLVYRPFRARRPHVRQTP